MKAAKRTAKRRHTSRTSADDAGLLLFLPIHGGASRKDKRKESLVFLPQDQPINRHLWKSDVGMKEYSGGKHGTSRGAKRFDRYHWEECSIRNPTLGRAGTLEANMSHMAGLCLPLFNAPCLLHWTRSINDIMPWALLVDISMVSKRAHTSITD